jgi:hypothetical protein
MSNPSMGQLAFEAWAKFMNTYDKEHKVCSWEELQSNHVEAFAWHEAARALHEVYMKEIDAAEVAGALKAMEQERLWRK